jgi:hypothetical protein
MPYVPGFKNDLFVSYAHTNNIPINEDKGWVSILTDLLRRRLPGLLHKRGELKVWQDERLQGNEQFGPEIEEAVRSSAVVISVMTYQYLASDWCCREVETFRAGPHERCGLVVNGKTRLFKVLPAHVPPDEQPEHWRGELGYPFYDMDPSTGLEELYRRTRPEDPDQRFWRRFEALARNIAQLLDEMAELEDEEAAEAVVAPPARTAPSIFIAEAADDLDEWRSRLLSAVAQRGVTVLPRAPYYQPAAAVQGAVEADLERAKLSVHLLGRYYGRRPEGDDRSITQIQLEIAAREGKQRIVWMPPGLKAEEVEQRVQRELIERIHSDSDRAGEVEVMQCGLDELTELVLNRLFAAEQPAPRAAVPEAPAPLIYISCQPEDNAQATALKQTLRNAKFDVVMDTEATNDSHFRTNLRFCDGFVLVYGSPPPVWIQKRALLAREAYRRRTRPFQAMSLFDGPPSAKPDPPVDFGDWITMRCRDEPQPECLERFVDQIQARFGR